MDYGRSKMLMERAVREPHQASQLETVILRPPWFYGPNQPPRQTLFFRMIRDGKAPSSGEATTRARWPTSTTLPRASCWRPSAPLRPEDLLDRRRAAVLDERDRRHGRAPAGRRVRPDVRAQDGCGCPASSARSPGCATRHSRRLGVYHQKIHVLSEMNKTIACSVAKAQRVLGYAPRSASRKA